MGWRLAQLADVPTTVAAGFWSEWAREPDLLVGDIRAFFRDLR